MPDTDEDIIRDLLRQCTAHLHPAVSIAAGVAARQLRRDRRRRVATLATAGVALGTAAGVIAAVPGHPARTPVGTGSLAGSRPAIRLTAEQQILYHLSAVAAGQPQGHGRYAVMSTAGDDVRDTSVIDRLTGNMWSYQQGSDGNPSGKAFSARYSPTAAQFAAMPVSLDALRAALIAQWDGEQRPVRSLRRTAGPAPRRRPLTVSADDKVFQQASYILWNPLVGPALRAALYRVLAAVPGVTVDQAARDGLGRPATEISRVDSSGLPGGKSDGISYATYENPATGAVLESTVTYPPGSDIVTPQDPTGNRTVVDAVLYLSVTWATAVPADPYGG
jgi:hypothetical protein